MQDKRAVEACSGALLECIALPDHRRYVTIIICECFQRDLVVGMLAWPNAQTSIHGRVVVAVSLLTAASPLKLLISYGIREHVCGLLLLFQLSKR